VEASGTCEFHCLERVLNKTCGREFLPRTERPQRERIRKSAGLLLDFVDLVLDGVLETLDADECDEICHADEDEAQTEQPGECDAGSVQVIQTEAAQHGAGNAEKHDHPPVGESEFLVVKTLDEQDDALEHHPKGENDRQRDGQPDGIAKEDDTDEDLQQRGEHTGTAVREESLRAQGEHETRDTGHKGETTDEHRHGDQCGAWIDETHNAGCDKQNTGNSQPNFTTFVHNYVI